MSIHVLVQRLAIALHSLLLIGLAVMTVRFVALVADMGSVLATAPGYAQFLAACTLGLVGIIAMVVLGMFQFLSSHRRRVLVVGDLVALTAVLGFYMLILLFDFTVIVVAVSALGGLVAIALAPQSSLAE